MGSKYTLRDYSKVGTIFLKNSVTGKPFLLHDLMRGLAGGGYYFLCAHRKIYKK